MVDVRRNDGPPPSQLAPDKFWRHPLPNRDEFHLGRDLAPTGIKQLGDRSSTSVGRPAKGLGNPRLTGTRGAEGSSVRLSAHPPVRPLHIPPEDPRLTQRGQSPKHVRILGPARVVDPKRRLASGYRDFTHRDPDAAWALEMDFAGAGEGVLIGIDGTRGGGGHGTAPEVRRRGSRWTALPSPVLAGSGSKGVSQSRPGYPWRSWGIVIPGPHRSMA
jgi:hypothetical protein